MRCQTFEDLVQRVPRQLGSGFRLDALFALAGFRVLGQLFRVLRANVGNRADDGDQ